MCSENTEEKGEETEGKRGEGGGMVGACVFIMGCLLSCRQQGVGGMETAVPLLPRKQEKCWTLKKITYSYKVPRVYFYTLSVYMCVCSLFHINENKYLQVQETAATF